MSLEKKIKTPKFVNRNGIPDEYKEYIEGGNLTYQSCED